MTNAPEPYVYEGDVITNPTADYWLDALERGGKSFLQLLIATFAAGVTITSVSWASVLLSAGLAALLSFGAALASTSVVPTTGNAVIDIVSRAARTFLVGFAAAIPATATSLADINWGATASIALTATVVSVLTSAASLPIGSKFVPSLVAR